MFQSILKSVESKGRARRPETHYSTLAAYGTKPISRPLVNKILVF